MAERTHWCQQQLRNFDPAVFNAPPRVLASRSTTIGGSQAVTEVVEDFNPVKSARNAGRPEIVARDNNFVCDVQPMALDYLQQERFKLYDRRPTTIYPGSFVNLQTLLNPARQF